MCKHAPLFVGALKAHIGHTEEAAGLAGVLKILAMFKHNAIPAQFRFDVPNRHIDWDSLDLEIPKSSIPWHRESPTRPRRAGVSSFGISGTNAHIVLEEPPISSSVSSPPKENEASLVPLSAKGPDALSELAIRYAEALEKTKLSPQSLAYSAACRRTHLDYRFAAVGASKKDLIEQLKRAATQQATAISQPPRIAFVFPGQGSQWAGMWRTIKHFDVCAETINACQAAFAQYIDWSLLEMLSQPADAEYWERIDIVQPMLFAIEIALAALWRSWGIEPDAVVGHSMGEVAAFYVSGALSLEDAARIICLRSKLMRRRSGEGEMAMLELSLKEAQEWIIPYPDVSIAVCNSPSSIVVSGAQAGIEKLLSRANKQGLFARRVKVDVASHSPQMEELRDELLKALEALNFQKNEIELFSTVDATWLETHQCDATYWYRNLREPVQFMGAVRAIIEKGPTMFVEISPHPILGPSISEILHDSRTTNHHGWVPSLRRDKDGQASMLSAAATLYTKGCALEWERFMPKTAAAELPLYPFRRERYWLANKAISPREISTGHPHVKARTINSLDSTQSFWTLDLDLNHHPYLQGHRVQGALILPTSAYLDIALECCQQIFGSCPDELFDIRLEKALVLAENPPRQVQLAAQRLDEHLVRFQIASMSETGWTTHATGLARRRDDTKRRTISPHDAFVVGQEVSNTYQSLSNMDLDYSETFCAIQQVWRATHKSGIRARIQCAESSEFRYHPATLDACLQTVALSMIHNNEGASARLRVPTYIERVRFIEPFAPSSELVAQAEYDDQRGHVTVLDQSNRLLLIIEGLETTEIDPSHASLHTPIPNLDVVWRKKGTNESPRYTEELADTSKEAAWLIMGGRPKKQDALLQEMTRKGVTAEQLEGIQHQAIQEGLTAFLRNQQHAQGVIFLAPEPAEQHEGLSQLKETIGCLATIVQMLGELPSPRPPLVVVTRRAQLVSAERGHTTLDLHGAALWGWAHAAEHEYPDICCTRIDLDLDTPWSALIGELVTRDRERRIAYRSGSRFVARLVEASSKNSLSFFQAARRQNVPSHGWVRRPCDPTCA